MKVTREVKSQITKLFKSGKTVDQIMMACKQIVQSVLLLRSAVQHQLEVRDLLVRWNTTSSGELAYK